MSNELKKEPLSKIEELEHRLKYCEAVASQYEMLYKQLKMEMKALADRQGNIQQVYDYLTKVGSSVAIKTQHEKKFLNPFRKSLPMSEPQKLEIQFKFSTGDEVYYANERDNDVSYHIVTFVDIINKHPRYCITGVFGYLDESKLFSTESEAQWQLDEWNRSSCL